MLYIVRVPLRESKEKKKAKASGRRPIAYVSPEGGRGPLRRRIRTGSRSRFAKRDGIMALCKRYRRVVPRHRYLKQVRPERVAGLTASHASSSAPSCKKLTRIFDCSNVVSGLALARPRGVASATDDTFPCWKVMIGQELEEGRIKRTVP